MNKDEIDYTKYSLEQLIGCQRNIDASRFPERAAQIDVLIKERLREKQVQKVTMADSDGNIASVKEGRAPSFGRGLSELIGGVLFGIMWISFSKDAPAAMSLIGYFVIASSVVTGSYHMYNAFAKNRFSASDIVSPSKESDPFERLVLGGKSEKKVGDSVRRFEGEYCPFCGSKVEITHDFCPSCGKDI